MDGVLLGLQRGTSCIDLRTTLTLAVFALFRSKARLVPLAVLAASALAGLVAHAVGA